MRAGLCGCGVTALLGAAALAVGQGPSGGVGQGGPAGVATDHGLLCAASGTDGRLTATVEAIAAEPAVARAHWGVAIVGNDGQCLAAINVGQFFHPASTAKLLTTAAAMEMGPAERVVTRLEARGPVIPGRGSGGGGQVLVGNLALVGAGDGTFATEDVPWQQPEQASHVAVAQTAAGLPAAKGMEALERLADAVVAAGIGRVEGDVVGDDTRLVWEPYGEDWAQDDLLWGYGAPVSALSVHDNQVRVGVRPGPAEGSSPVVETEPGMPAWWTIEANGLRTGASGSGTHVGLDRVPGRPRVLRVWGTIAADTPELTEELAIEEPALYAAETLRGMLLARGVGVTGIARAEHRLPEATAGPLRLAAEPWIAGVPCCSGEGCVCASTPEPATGRVLAEVRSPQVAEDVLATNKESLNLHAELLLERLGLRAGGPPPAAGGNAEASGEATRSGQAAEEVVRDAGSRAQGLRVVRSLLVGAGVAPGDVVLVDGSGLSTHDLVTPRAMAALMLWVGRQPWSATWRATLPVGGVDGTLRSRFAKAPLQGRVVAKTGTLGESRALVGVVRCASGREVVVAVYVDAHTPQDGADRQAMDRIIETVYRAE